MHVTISDGINSGDDELLWDGSLGELVDLFLVGEVHPVLPLVGLGEVAVVVNGTSVESWGNDLILELCNAVNLTIAELLEELIEWASTGSSN